MDPDERDQIKEAVERMTFQEMTVALQHQITKEPRGVRVYYNHKDITDQVLDSKIIEGTAVRVEKDPARLLDAGGSEP